MSCTNCFNGCAEILSDQCIKYTGVDIPSLNIQNGDSLKNIEDSLTQILLTVLVGTGIKPIVDSETVCETVKKYIPVCSNCGGPTLNEILQALMDAACDLQTQIDAIVADINTLEQAYTNPGCLTIVDTTTSVTHNVLQAVITKLCTVSTDLAALILDVDTNYVKIEDINTYISTYLAESGTSTKLFNRMIPNVAVEWYGNPSGKFDVSGAGLGDWEKIYLCNGNNGTPDKRGRVAVGATDGMGGGAFNSAVDPSILGNPTYNLLTIGGTNTITLGKTQIPSHTHVATVNDLGHSHFLLTEHVAGTFVYPPSATDPIVWQRDYHDWGSYRLSSSTIPATLGLSSATPTGITVDNASTGGGQSHNNIQPVLATYYIIYLP